MTNLKLWNAVSKTDPKNTTKVNQRGGFTAIAAHSQIKAATEQFGPIGTGWGHIISNIFFEHDCVFVEIKLWYNESALTTFSGIGQCQVVKDGRVDQDAAKKAETDAITKALSRLGFNADVFEGKFDDNKYIEKQTKEYAKKPNATTKSRKECGTNDEIKSAFFGLLWLAGDYGSSLNVTEKFKPEFNMLKREGTKDSLALVQEMRTGFAEYTHDFPDHPRTLQIGP